MLINVEKIQFSDGVMNVSTGVFIPTPTVNNPPTGIITISGNAIQDETLSIQNTLKDADGLGTFSYQWLQNGKPISGATQATYTLSENDIGTAIKVKVSYTDGLKKLESVTSAATDLIEPKPEEILPPTYTLSVDKTTVNEGETVTFNLITTNVVEDTEIPFSVGGTISNTDVLGGLKTTSFFVDADGKASLPMKFLADKLTEGTETLTVTLADNKTQTVSITVNDTSLTPKPIDNSTSTPTIKIDGEPQKGDANNNLLIGTEKNDSISGLAGADTLRGNAGDDVLEGGVGNDSIDAGNGNDKLLGGDGNDTLLAGSGNDSLEGGKGDDKLVGDKGNDTLKGGLGADNMTGGEGDDYYFVDNKKDVVTEAKSSGNDTIESTSTYTLGKNVENLILTGITNNDGIGNESDNQMTGNVGDNNLNGNAGNDKLVSGAGADTLDGGKGMDTLIGGDDDDTYFMNNDNDKIIETENGGAQDQVVSTVSFELSTSPNIEVLTLSGAKALQGGGDEFNNLLQEIDGGKVANVFDGKEGDDTINGEGGNDTIEGGEGNDIIDGGDGKDVAIFNGASTDYQITRNSDTDGVAQLVVEYKGHDDSINEGTDILTNIEVLQFADNETINAQDIEVTVTTSGAMLVLTGVIV